MDTILLLSHVDDGGALPRAALEALAAAKALGAPITAALFGPSVAAAAADLAARLGTRSQTVTTHWLTPAAPAALL